MACYIIGLVVGNLIFLPCTGILAPLLTIAGALLALPILILVILVFASMREKILRHLVVWCVATPFYCGRGLADDRMANQLFEPRTWRLLVPLAAKCLGARGPGVCLCVNLLGALLVLESCSVSCRL